MKPFFNGIVSALFISAKGRIYKLNLFIHNTVGIELKQGYQWKKLLCD